MADEPETRKGAMLDPITLEATGRVLTPTVESMAHLVGDHPIYKQIGRVVAQFAHVEHDLDVAIWLAMGVEPEIGASITSQVMGIPPRCRALLQLATQRKLPEDVLDAIKAFETRIHLPNERRNRIVHDAWYIGGDGVTQAQFRSFPKRSDDFATNDINDAAIDESIRLASSLRDRSNDLMKRVRDALRASSDT